MKIASPLAASLLLWASCALAGKTSVEFYPGLEGYVSSPDIACSAYSSGNRLTVTVEGSTSRDSIVFTRCDVPYRIWLEVRGGLKTLAAKVPDMDFEFAGVDFGTLSVKMKGCDFAVLECQALKKAQVRSLESLVQEGDGLPSGTAVKAFDHIGIGNVNDYSLGRFSGRLKSLAAPRILNIYGSSVVNGNLHRGQGVSAAGVLKLKARTETPGCRVFLPYNVTCKAKNVKVATGPEYGNFMRADLATGEIDYPATAPAFWSQEDKTRYMWFSEIRAGSFLMGSYEDEPGRDASVESVHQVTLTRDFWMAIFELTAGQYAYITGEGDKDDARAKGDLTYLALRGGGVGRLFPEEFGVDSDSILGKFRTLCGGREFDLPTEAQWEYACKADTMGTWNDESEILSAGGEDLNLNSLGWYGDNSKNMVREVGLLTPNIWNLYDMHGNVFEWCLDWFDYQDVTEDQTDPLGPASSWGYYRVQKGGDYKSIPATCRSAQRSYGLKSTPGSGARFMLAK